MEEKVIIDKQDLELIEEALEIMTLVHMGRVKDVYSKILEENKLNRKSYRHKYYLRALEFMLRFDKSMKDLLHPYLQTYNVFSPHINPKALKCFKLLRRFKNSFGQKSIEDIEQTMKRQRDVAIAKSINGKIGKQEVDNKLISF